MKEKAYIQRAEEKTKAEVTEYDGYKYPFWGKDTPENREIAAKAMEEARKFAAELDTKYGE